MEDEKKLPTMRPAHLIFPEKWALIQQKKCPMCAKEVGEFKDELSKKEYGISGMCQTCQDNFFEKE